MYFKTFNTRKKRNQKETLPEKVYRGQDLFGLIEDPLLIFKENIIKTDKSAKDTLGKTTHITKFFIIYANRSELFSSSLLSSFRIAFVLVSLVKVPK